MKKERCINWVELDDTVEYCKKKSKKCSCGATKKNCQYPKLFKNNVPECKDCGYYILNCDGIKDRSCPYYKEK